MWGIAAAVGLAAGSTAAAAPQEPAAPQAAEVPRVPPLLITEFQPTSRLRVPETKLTHARFPAVDVHTHCGLRTQSDPAALADYVQTMNDHRIAVSVSLDAALGSSWDEHRRFLWGKHEPRFAIFVHIDWQGAGRDDDPASWDCNQPGFVRRTVELLRRARDEGACGLKIFKEFGLRVADAHGQLLRIDDPQWDPIWEACGAWRLPVLIHTADPDAFFEPVDPRNERYEELSRHPEWSFADPRFPRRDELLTARNRVIERHPKTVFIGAHVANNPEDLQTVGKWLDRYPNLFVDTASRIGELGRQPFSAGEFFERYQDRILLGTDGPWPGERLALYWRFFETRDEYFPYSEKPTPPQGFWQIYGLELSDEVLAKVYYKNACRLIPGMIEKYVEGVKQLAAEEP